LNICVFCVFVLFFYLKKTGSFGIRPEGRGWCRHGGMSVGTGRFLIRLSDSLFLAPQSDLEKKATRRSKELREKRPNPGSFCFNAEGGSFFWRRKNFRVASLASK
jgi:hypothetical protein